MNRAGKTDQAAAYMRSATYRNALRREAAFRFRQVLWLATLAAFVAWGSIGCSILWDAWKLAHTITN